MAKSLLPLHHHPEYAAVKFLTLVILISSFSGIKSVRWLRNEEIKDPSENEGKQIMMLL
jgi:hypothetical protein